METVLSCSNDSVNDNLEITRFSEQCKAFPMITIPTFCLHQTQDEEYNFLEPVIILKSESQPDFPEFIRSKIDNLKSKYPDIKQDYFHITLSTSSLITPTSDKDINSSYTLLNLIAQPYIFYNSPLDNNNKEHKSEMFCAAFTDDLELDTIKETETNDNLKINPKYNLDDGQLKREVILQKGDAFPVLAPNNCSILVNLNAQFINFYVVICVTYEGKIVRCFLGNFLIIPNANTSKLFKDVYISLIKENKKMKIGEELIIFKNKFNEYINYIFSFGIDEIVKKATCLRDIKICITKAFSIIFEFENENNDDNDSKKIYEKKVECMKEYYYNNFLNFIYYLYENGRNIDEKFAEIYLECTLKKKYIEELLVKYKLFSIKKIKKIISDYLFFIFDNDNIADDLEEKTKEKYDQEILPDLKESFKEYLNRDEEELDEIKDNYSEDNRIHIGNPYIEILINICNDIRNEEEINMDELDDILKKYLFYIVWVHKGKKQGVHNDFGRLSFLNEEIDKQYFCNPDDKIDCCQKLMQYLENADEKHF